MLYDMAVEKLVFGDILAGLLVDGDPDTLYAGCTLRMEEPRGAVIEVPYIHMDSTKQFAPVQAWFSTRTSPPNMLLRTASGAVSLFDIQWDGHSVKSGNSVSLGKLRPMEIVLSNREADLEDPLLVTELRSHVDGLREWSRFTAIKHDTEANENNLVRKLTVEVESVAQVSWKQGDATMTLQTDWRTANPEGLNEGSFNIFEWVVLDSKFDEGHSFFDHYVEQRKLVHLLILVFGKPVHFRKHQVRDDSFSQRLNGGKLVNHPFVQLISRRTVGEYAEKPPTKEDLQRPLVYLREIGQEGLQRWADEFERWTRFTLPATATLGKRNIYVGDLVVSLSMSLEAAGHIIGVRDGEEETYREKSTTPTTASYVYRCLHLLDLDWGDRVASPVGLARAVANGYNGTKHYNKGVLPDNDQTFLISEVLRKVTRLLTLHIVDPSGELLKSSREPGGLWRMQDMFEANELRIKHDGKWEHEAKPEFGEPPEGVTFG